MSALITLNPIDPGTDTRVTVRLCSTQNPADTGADGQVWWPAIVAQPVIQARLFDGDFTSGVDAGSASVEISLGVLMRSGAFPRVERYDWAGATATIQRLSGGTLQTLATMKVDTFTQEALNLGLRLAASAELFDVDVLATTYAGTGGAEGGADLKGQVKPWVFGRAANVEPVFIDQINNVFQVSGYGPVQAISAVYERGSSFGASVGNFTTYALLVAATIPAGRWGTCLAQGLIRLGAPPVGVITCDVDGDNSAGFLRRTGAILGEIASRRGLSSNVNATSLASLDTAVARNVNVVISAQISFMEMVQRMAAPCNAVPGIGQDGKLLVSRVASGSSDSRVLLEDGSFLLLENNDKLLLNGSAFGTEQFTLDAQGREMPPVLGMTRQNTSAPYKRIQMGAARSWRVHSFDEIAFYSNLTDRGIYSASTIYREGNIVSLTDKSRWLYVAITPGSGNAPPTWPTTSNAFWSSLEGPASLDDAIRNTAITVVSGNIGGIGTGNGTSVDNTRNILRDNLSNLPGTGAFVGQQFAAIDTKDVLRWGGAAWVSISDITGAINGPSDLVLNYAADLTLTSPLPVTGSYQLVLAGSGAVTSGVTWAVSIVSGAFASTAPSMVGTSSGVLRINSAMTSPEALLRITATVGGKTYPPAFVTISRYVAPPSIGTLNVSAAITSISSSTFARMHAADISVTLPSGVTSASLTASFGLDVTPVTPVGSTTVEGKWQRESSPGTWTDVGSVATSSPSPNVYDTGLLDGSSNPVYAADPGSMSCTATASGLSAGSAQKFRFMARVSSGNVRNVTGDGMASVAA